MELLHRKPRVLCNFDEFTYNCFKPECEILVPLNTTNWIQTIEQNNFDFFFVESTWKPIGKGITLAYTGALVTRNKYSYLKAIIKYLNKKNIPTVFWNKEDNKFFNEFSVYAPLFDYVFTTDQRTLHLYKRKCKKLKRTKEINTLIFAAQPLLHNPIKDYDFKKYEGDVFFAGAWYNFAQRIVELKELLTLPRQIKLHIYDRKFDGKKSNFPKEFWYRLKKAVPYKEICKKYKRYPIMLSVNSVKGSETMFARRVPEALICKTSVITTPSISIRKHFPGVFMKRTNAEVSNTILMLLRNNSFREKHNHVMMRNVLVSHTYFNRMVQICKTIKVKPPEYKLKVVVLYDDEKVNTFIKEQNYPNIVKSLKINDNVIDDIFINRKVEDKEIEDLGFVVVMNSNYQYGKYYVTDSILSFQFNEHIDIIGKACYLKKDKYINVNDENRFVNNISIGSMCISLKGDLDKRKEKLIFLKKVLKDKKIPDKHKMNILSIDRYNFMEMK